MKKTVYLILSSLLIATISLTACQSGDATVGRDKYLTSCASCHGSQGTGITGEGTDLIASEFMANNSDGELVNFIKVGRRPTSPNNSSGMGMPPKGGTPSLTDQDLYDIVAYLRTLH